MPTSKKQHRIGFQITDDQRGLLISFLEARARAAKSAPTLEPARDLDRLRKSVQESTQENFMTPQKLEEVAHVLDLPPDVLWLRLKTAGGASPAAAGTPGAESARDLAYKIMIQLTTRVVAAPFDWEHDLLPEVYNSWYASLQRVRDLTESVSVTHAGSDWEVQRVINLGSKTILTMREHLTPWQAKFRTWYGQQKISAKQTPQQVQTRFPQFAQLKQSYLQSQRHLAKLAAELHEFAFGAKPPAADRPTYLAELTLEFRKHFDCEATYQKSTDAHLVLHGQPHARGLVDVFALTGQNVDGKIGLGWAYQRPDGKGWAYTVLLTEHA